MNPEQDNTTDAPAEDWGNAEFRQSMIDGGMTKDLEPEAPVDDDNGGEEQEPVPTQPPAQSPDDEDDEPSGLTIPKARFDKEVAKRRDAEKAAMKAQLQAEQIEEAIKAFAANKNGESESADEDNEDYDALDPATHKLAQKALKEAGDIKATMDRAAQAGAFANSLANQEAEFMQTAPDFRDALGFFKQLEVKKNMALGATEQEARDATTAYLHNLATAVHSNDGSVPEAIYKMAQAVGYAKAGAKAPATPKGPNLDKIAENKDKSAGLNEIAAGGAPGSDTGSTEGFKKLLTKTGKTDLSLLMADIDKIKRQNRS